MNSMRLLILLAFVLHEMRYSKSIKPLNLLKTLIDKHFQHQPASEHEILEIKVPILEEKYPVITSHETIEDSGTIYEWNNKLYEPISTNTGIGETLEEITEMIFKDDKEISDVNSNSERDGEKNTHEKNPNTEWLLEETLTEKQPEADQDKNKDTPSIKNKICDTFKSMITKIKEEIKPITVPTIQISSFPPNDNTNYTTTVSTMSTPVTTPESTTPIRSTIISSTENPPKNCISYNHGNVNIKCPPAFPYIQPQPLPTHPYYYPSPYQPWQNNCAPTSNQQPFNCQPNIRYILYPVYISTYSMKPQPLNNVPYAGGVPDYQRVMDYGVLKETPNYQPLRPVNADQWANYNNYGSRLKSHSVHQSYPVSSFVLQTSRPAAAEVSPNNMVFPNLGYPTHTMAPIVVKPYPADNVPSSVLPVEHRDPTNGNVDSLNRLLEPVPMPNNGQDYPYRGDIRIIESGPTNMYERQLEGNLQKERRQIDYDHEKMPLAPSKIPLIDLLAQSETPDAKSNISNVNVVDEKTSDFKLP